jgi:hypothetical protein
MTVNSTKLNFALYTFLGVFMISCIQEPVQNGLGGYINDEDYQEQFIDNTIESDITKEVVEMDTIQLDTSFIDFSNEMIDLLATNELIQFSEHFHPEKGCAFMPYTFLSDVNQIFKTSVFKKQLESNDTLVWGSQDGSGEPIVLTISDYMTQWVYDFDYKNHTTDIHINGDLAFSNTLNNISKIYPEAQFIEFYNEGTTKYEGMDWKSLIFYVEKLENTYYLVAVVHNQWTI